MLQKKFQRWILKRAPGAPRDHDLPNPVAKLQQGLEEYVVLMIVRNQHVIDNVRKVLVGVAGDVALVGITHNRVNDHTATTRVPPTASHTYKAPAGPLPFTS